MIQREKSRKRFTVARTPVQLDTQIRMGEQLTRTGQLGLTPMRLQFAFAGRIAWEKDALPGLGRISTLGAQCDQHESNYAEMGRFGTAGVDQTYIV